MNDGQILSMKSGSSWKLVLHTYSLYTYVLFDVRWFAVWKPIEPTYTTRIDSIDE